MEMAGDGDLIAGPELMVGDRGAVDADAVFAFEIDNPPPAIDEAEFAVPG